MDQELIQKAKEIIEKIIYITLATATTDGIPWNTPLISAYDEKYNFYWRSAKDAIHSKNIKANDKVFITIYDTFGQDWNFREAVYIQATVKELSSEAKINEALFLIDKRSGTTFGKADQFMNNFPRRVYKATPEKIWMNVDGEINGNFIDKRAEIKLV
jgi:general stress protein 26